MDKIDLLELADLTAALDAALDAIELADDATAEALASAVEDLADAVEAWGEEVTRLRRHLGRVVARLRVQAEEAEADRAAAARREVAGRETEAELWRKATASPEWLEAAEAAWLAEAEEERAEEERKAGAATIETTRDAGHDVPRRSP